MTALHWPGSALTVIADGQAIVGTSVSFTVTVNEQVACKLFASKAVAITVVVPIVKKSPELAEVVTVGTPQLSVAVTEKLTFAPHTPTPLLTPSEAGQVMTGAWLSSTCTSKLQVAVFPAASVAVY